MDDTPRHRSRVGRGAPTSLLARLCALTLAVGLLSGCGDDGLPTGDPGGGGYAPPERSASGGGGGDPAAEEIVIVIEDFGYEVPNSVRAGAEIVVRNEDGVGHTVTADEGDTFDVEVPPGEEVTFTAPSEAGEYPFHCTPHPAMTSTLVVEGEG